MQVYQWCVLGMIVLGLLSACTHKPLRVDCEGRLQPINRPAAVEGRNPSESGGTPSATSRPTDSQVFLQGDVSPASVDTHAAAVPSTDNPEHAP
jgi:hypothetical protein